MPHQYKFEVDTEILWGDNTSTQYKRGDILVYNDVTKTYDCYRKQETNGLPQSSVDFLLNKENVKIS